MLFTKVFWNLSFYFKHYNILPKDPLQVFMKNPKIFTNKSPWGIKTRGNMCTQPSSCEQAQAKSTSRRQRRVGKQPLFIPNKKPNSHWQHQKPNSHWQHHSPILIGNIKTQFSLVLFCQKRTQAYQYLAKKKYHGNILPWQKPWQSSYKKTHWELSWCSHIINPWNTWTSFASWPP